MKLRTQPRWSGADRWRSACAHRSANGCHDALDASVFAIITALVVWEYVVRDHAWTTLHPSIQAMLLLTSSGGLLALVASALPGAARGAPAVEPIQELGRGRLAALCAALMLPALIGTSRTVAAEDARISAVASIAVAGLVAARIGMGYRRLTDELGRRLAAEQNLHRATTIDALTGLMKREAFDARVTAALAQPSSNGLVAAMCLDLDHFKMVNDGVGHCAGDAVLGVVAERLQASVRDGDLIARLDGDEFAVLLEGLADVGEALALGEQLRTAIHQPMKVGDLDLTLSASIGIAFAEHGATDTNRLLADTDAAVVEAKRRGRNAVVAFDVPMGRRAAEWLRIEHDLAEAIGRQELRLHYQPQVELPTGRITAVEGLIRWQHPTQGLIGPGAFLDVAEESGLIVPIGIWVIEEAARQAQTWRCELGALAPRISINVSPTQLARDDVSGTIARVLRDHQLPPSALVVEVTESALMVDPEKAARTLEEIDRLGVELAVDDFGTGYFSLSHLRRLPVRTLKVDQTFVAGLGRDAEDEAIVVATIGLAHSLGLNVIAEGVETPGQLRRLVQEGCDMAQGYLFGRPVPAEELSRDLRARPVRPEPPITTDGRRRARIASGSGAGR